MHRGYTKRWRKRWDKNYHHDFLLWLLMDYFIDFANYKDSEVFFPNVGVIPLKRGQHIFGTRKLAEFMRIDRQRIRTKLKKLEKIGFLILKSTHQFTIATILNYNTYNPLIEETNPPNNPDLTHTKPTPNPRLTLPNKENKEKKGKKGNNIKNESPSILKINEYPDWLNLPI